MTCIRVDFHDVVRAGAEKLEWPPHPARLFAAMVAAYYDGCGNEVERDLLLRMECLPPPAISLPQVGIRTTPVVYVPSNMRNEKATGADAAPLEGNRFLRRLRSGRRFPAGTVNGPVHYHFADDGNLDEAVLSQLIDRIPYLGTTASTCVVSAVKDPPLPSLLPDLDASTQRNAQPLRVPYPGNLASLEQCHNANLKSLVEKGKRTHVPDVHWCRYVTAENVEAAAGEFSELIPVQLEGPGIGLLQGPELCRAFRRAIIGCVPDPVPETISGHLQDGTLSRTSHLGFVPLAFVGHKFADGHLMGIGLLVPRSMEIDHRMKLLAGLSNLTTLHTAIGNYAVSRCPEAWTLNSGRYARESRQWASVTPIELPTYPNRRRQPSDLIASACEHSGLPKPVHVEVSSHNLLKGSVSAKDFARERTPLIHARLLFDRPVKGPIALGRGRYLGLGLCLPC